ncbi:copper amine oxidase N-terminal domain-containing protein [Aneurinibacillus migulanus]|uniref:copper amine oxidase N-terminal domain-containing protein n=1 Tax=Aneurinibacillus migulanus TaxID=47500 RepID=UPI002E1B8877|nr:copper amine oxidase N-terminal domain-containing protein [Aneurinibacillus migulanus]
MRREQSKLYQKLVTASLATSLALTAVSAAAYAEVSTGAKSQVTGSSVNASELVPVRTVAEALGALIEWDEKARAAKVTKGSTVLILKIGEKRVTLDGATIDAHRPSFFSSLSPQEFVDVSNQMYIVGKGYLSFLNFRFSIFFLYEIDSFI